MTRQTGKCLRWLTLCLLVVTVAAAAFATEFAVLVNPANPVKAMSLLDLGRILKGKTATWQSGRVITVVIRDPNSPAMKFVIERVMGMPAEEGKNILNELNHKPGASVIFVPTDEDVVNAVSVSQTAIGIADVYEITSGVKVIKIDDKQPFDSGYALKGR